MPLPFMAGGVGLVSLPEPIVANWSIITFTAPTTEGTNSDIALNFAAGPASRSIYAVKSGNKGTLYYRINSGSWVSYLASGTGAPFTFTAGQTVGWKFELTGPGVTNETITVRDGLRGDIIDTFTVTRV